MAIYIKLDCQALTDAKLLEAGPDGYWVWSRGLLYSKEHLTDGYLPDGALNLICMKIADPERVCADLIRIGLWQRVEGGYTVGAERWAKRQTTRDQVEKKREQDRLRQQKKRAKKAGHASVTDESQRDANKAKKTSRTCHSTNRVQSTESKSESGDRDVSPKSKDRNSRKVTNSPSDGIITKSSPELSSKHIPSSESITAPTREGRSSSKLSESSPSGSPRKRKRVTTGDLFGEELAS